QPSLSPRREVDSKHSLLRVIGEYVDRELDGILPEPDEPAPVFLVRVDVAGARRYGRQQAVDDGIAADAALVEVVVAAHGRNLLRERNLVWHEAHAQSFWVSSSFEDVRSKVPSGRCP